MPTIGITGGIASGKSAVTSTMEEMGAMVFSADTAAREVLAPGSEGLQEVIAAFGTEVLLPDGSLNRSRLARMVFSDEQARRRLEAITHPRIRALLKSWIESAKSQNPPLIAVEVPLLFESGMEEWFDKTVVVTASEAIQTQRLRDRSYLSDDEARARIASQMPLAEKAARADHVIPNDGSIADLRASVKELWPALLRE